MAVCYLKGEIDMSKVPDCEAELMNELDEDVHLVVDCSELTFIDSSGLNMLLRVRNEAVERGGSLVVRSVPSSCRRTFEVTNLDDVLFESDD